MPQDPLSRPRQTGLLILVLILATAVVVGVFPSRSWRSLLRDDLDVSVTWQRAGMGVADVERRLLRPLEDTLVALGARELIGSAGPGVAQLSATITPLEAPPAIAARLASAASASDTGLGAPSISIVRASSDVTTDVLRILIAIALSLALPPLLASVARLPAVAAERRPSAIRRCVWRNVDAVLDRFQDLLAHALRHRGRIGPTLLVFVAAAIVAAYSGAPTRSAQMDNVGASTRWRVDVFGEDLQTLAGMAMRVAAEVRQVPGVLRVEVTPPSGDIRHVNGKRAALVAIDVDPELRSLGDSLQHVVSLTLAPASHPFELLRDDADDGDDAFTGAALVFAAAIALLLALAIRHGNWEAPITMAVGEMLVLVGAVLAPAIIRDRVDLWTWLGAALPLVMFVHHGSALFAQAERAHTTGSQLHVALIDAGRARLRPLLLVSACQALVLAPFAWLTAPRVSRSALGALSGLATVVVGVALAAPVTYESVHLALARWRTAMLTRRLRRSART